MLDAYECQCKAGYYKPKNTTKLTDPNFARFNCLKCADGCETCEGNVVELFFQDSEKIIIFLLC